MDRTESGKIFAPRARAIEGAMVGPYMIVIIAAGLAVAAITAYALTEPVPGTAMIDLALLGFTLLVAAAIAAAPLRRIRQRRTLRSNARAGKYRIVLDPETITVENGANRFSFDFKDYASVGSDGSFLGNSRNWGGMVLSRDRHERLSWGQRAGVVKAIRKGDVTPVTRDGITTIPLSYFTGVEYDEIIETARRHHARAR